MDSRPQRMHSGEVARRQRILIFQCIYLFISERWCTRVVAQRRDECMHACLQSVNTRVSCSFEARRWTGFWLGLNVDDGWRSSSSLSVFFLLTWQIFLFQHIHSMLWPEYKLKACSAAFSAPWMPPKSLPWLSVEEAVFDRLFEIAWDKIKECN